MWKQATSSMHSDHNLLNGAITKIFLATSISINMWFTGMQASGVLGPASTRTWDILHAQSLNP